MLKCKRKKFNKFLFLSFVFLAFSICFNLLAAATIQEVKRPVDLSTDSKQIQVQQREIIHSLKRITKDLPSASKSK